MRIFQPIISGSLTQSGSAVISGSLTVTSGITGSLYGTASWAVSASYLSGYVSPFPYIGNAQITGSLLLTASYISTVDYIDFNTGSVEPAWKSGRVYWNDTDGALSVYNAEADIALQIGQENWVKIYNASGVLITNGSAVKLAGTHGDVPEVLLAQTIRVSGSVSRDNQILGIATHDIEINSFGFITTQGLIKGVNTNAFSDGDKLYVSSSAGKLTNVPPTAPYEIIPAGVVVKAGPGGSGIIYSNPSQPTDFSDLSSTEVGTYSNGDIWTYVPSGSVGVWRHQKQLSGSYAITGSLTATTFIGSLNGNATSATTASLVNGNVNVTTATIGNTVYATAGTTVGAGTTSIYSVPNSSYSSIFVDYAINEGTTNARAGTIQVISVGSNLNFTETTTMDIGNTNDISWYIYLSGADINFEIINAAGASWTIKFSSRQM